MIRLSNHYTNNGTTNNAAKESEESEPEHPGSSRNRSSWSGTATATRTRRSGGTRATGAAEINKPSESQASLHPLAAIHKLYNSFPQSLHPTVCERDKSGGDSNNGDMNTSDGTRDSSVALRRNMRGGWVLSTIPFDIKASRHQAAFKPDKTAKVVLTEHLFAEPTTLSVRSATASRVAALERRARER